METFGFQGLSLLQDGGIPLGVLLITALLLLLVGKAIPSRRGMALMLAPIPLILLSWGWPPALWLVSLYNPALLLLFLADRFLLSIDPGQIALSRTLNPKFSIGQENPVQLTIVNNSPLALHGLVRDDAPPELHAVLTNDTGKDTLEYPIAIPSYGQSGVTYSLIPRKRGAYTFERIHLQYRSRLGLLWIRHAAGRPESIKVYPDLRQIRRMSIRYARGLSAGERQKRHLGLEGTQFSGLRNYTVGDDLKRMAWSATARLDTPVVRTFTHEVDQPVLVLLDAGRKMASVTQGLTKFDWALNTALAFAAVTIEQGDHLGVGVFSNKVISQSPAGRGRKHLRTLIDTLSELEPQATEPDYEGLMLHFARQLKRRSLVVVISDLIDPMSSRALRKGLKAFSKQHLLMVVTFSDSEVSRLADHYPGSAFEAYEKGAALDLIAQRRQTLQELSRLQGVVVIDAPPDQMDEALINRYLAIKLKNKL